MDAFVAMGEVVKAVGLKGEVKLYPLLDYWPDVLGSAYAVWEDGTPAPVIGHRPAGSCEALRLDGVTDRNGAERLVGRRLGFRRENYLAEDFPRPEGGLPFRFLDRPVVTTEGEAVGRVAEVRFTGGGYLLVVAARGEARGEILVPAVVPILRPDEGLDGDLVIDPPEGLLDVQSP